jgi:hypothetical protein
MPEQLPKHAKAPRIINEVPGYWALPPDMRRLVDERMKARAEQRDLGEGGEEEEESS